jgi:hypothetical protein
MTNIDYHAAIAQGLKRYRTGRACRNGHVAERYVTSRACVECDRKLWRSALAHLTTETCKVTIRIPKDQPRERIAILEQRLQAAADAYFAPRR